MSAAATATTRNKIYNNLIYNIGNNGTLGGIYMPSGTHVEVYHNTISLENTAATTGTVYGIYSTGTAGVDLKNNNIYINQGGTTKFGIHFTGAGKTSNHNNIYVAGTGVNHVGFFSTNFSTLANWQGANSSAWDQNSIAVDPMFANAIGGNLTPTNSLLDNLGTPLATVTTDFNGVTRNVVTPDIGALEFSVPPCGGTPTPGTASIIGNVTSGCMGTPI
ncbi:MAG TPA: hypothetical protein PL009_12055, partial [Flavipsychrobacter sp.]|nr:hypothetical protein [Flavipsychrobacter sp.]